MRWPVHRQGILAYESAIEKAWLLDLDDLLPILGPRYSAIGRPSAPAPEILRSLVLMAHLKEESIDAWILRLRGDDLLAVICGFTPGRIPGVGTFYAFHDRFWPGRRPRRIRKARKKRAKPAKGEKLPPKHPGVVKQIVERLLQGREFNCREESILHQILPSLELGLLGDPGDMTIAGDGSPYESGGSPHGKKICKCEGRRDCERRFSDPEADWGWDGSHSVWFYGYTGYDITAAGSRHDLPIYIGMGQASRHDSVMGLSLPGRLPEALPGDQVCKISCRFRP